MGKHIAFGWYGGKFSHLDWLLPLLPATQHYCEPFGGSAAVLINREPSPGETYNDVDGEDGGAVGEAELPTINYGLVRSVCLCLSLAWCCLGIHPIFLCIY